MDKNFNTINKKSWKQFKDSGLLWFVNSILHVFGWAIVLEVEDDGSIVNAYPARVTFRGFAEKSNTDGYIKLSQYMKENADILLEESKN